MGFSRQGYWSGLPFSSPGDLPDPGIELRAPASLALQADSLPSEPPGKPITPKLTWKTWTWSTCPYHSKAFLSSEAHSFIHETHFIYLFILILGSCCRPAPAVSQEQNKPDKQSRHHQVHHGGHHDVDFQVEPARSPRHPGSPPWNTFYWHPLDWRQCPNVRCRYGWEWDWQGFGKNGASF